MMNDKEIRTIYYASVMSAANMQNKYILCDKENPYVMLWPKQYDFNHTSLSQKIIIEKVEDFFQFESLKFDSNMRETQMDSILLFSQKVTAKEMDSFVTMTDLYMPIEFSDLIEYMEKIKDLDQFSKVIKVLRDKPNIYLKELPQFFKKIQSLFNSKDECTDFLSDFFKSLSLSENSQTNLQIILLRFYPEKEILQKFNFIKDVEYYLNPPSIFVEKQIKDCEFSIDIDLYAIKNLFSSIVKIEALEKHVDLFISSVANNAYTETHHHHVFHDTNKQCHIYFCVNPESVLSKDTLKELIDLWCVQLTQGLLANDYDNFSNKYLMQEHLQKTLPEHTKVSSLKIKI